MQRRKFRREFGGETLRLVNARGVSVTDAACDLDVHEDMLRKRAIICAQLCDNQA